MRCVFVFFMLVAIGTAVFATDVSSCEVINTSGSYQLINDVAGAPNSASPVSGNTCIKIASSNVTFDCGGHSITYDADPWGAAGILVNGSSGFRYSNITIKNCSGISNYSYGVYGVWVNDSIFYNITAYNNYYGGIYLSNAFNTTIENSTSSNRTGVYLSWSNNITVRNVRTYNNTDYCAFLSSSNNNTFINNSCSDSYTGFYLSSSYDNQFIGNNASNISNYGFYTCYSSPNVIIGNNVYNASYGIYHCAALGAVVANNSLQENRVYDFYLSPPPTDAACDMVVQNNTGSGGRPIEYTNESVEWSNLEVAGMVLCDADGSNLTNITVRGSDVWRNNDLSVYRTSNLALANSNSSSNRAGFSILYSCSHLQIENNTAYNNSEYGFRLYQCDNSSLVNNTASATLYYGISLEGSSDINVTGNAAYLNNLAGISASDGAGASYNNNLLNNTVYDNTQDGIWIGYSDSRNNTVAWNTAYGNNGNGFHIYGSNHQVYNNTARGNGMDFQAAVALNSSFTSNNATDGSYGYYIILSYDSNFTNNTAYNDSYGFYIGSPKIRLLGNVAQESDYLDLYVFPNTFYCDNVIANMTGSGGRPINFTNESVSWSNLDASEVILCGISNSVLDNITVRGSDTKSNNGLLVIGANNLTLENSRSIGNYYGFYFDSSDTYEDSIINNTASGNNHGFSISYMTTSNFTNNTAFDNAYGFFADAGTGVNFTNNAAYNNSMAGFCLNSSFTANTRLSGNTVFNNTIGLHNSNSTNTMVAGDRYYGNGIDILVNITDTAKVFNISSAIFDSPAGNMSNYTNISLYDNAAAGSAYSINWSQRPATMPAEAISFADKFINITPLAGTVTIDSAVWHWADSELDGHTESSLALYEYDGSGWTVLNTSPGITTNSLGIVNLSPTSIYGIMEAGALCNATIIAPPGGMSVYQGDYFTVTSRAWCCTPVNCVGSSAVLDPVNLTGRTCTLTWGADCGLNPDSDNTFDTCSNHGTVADEHVGEVTLNATSVLPGTAMSVTCDFVGTYGGDYGYAWYYNGTGWRQLGAWALAGAPLEVETAQFTADSVEGTHWVRCGISYAEDSDNCIDSSVSYHDNDDVNFTVEVSSIQISDMSVYPSLLGIGSVGACRANASGINPIVAVSFNITLPNSSVVSLGNGTFDGSIWTSPLFTITANGSHICTVLATDDQNNTGSDVFPFTTGAKGAVPMNSGTPFYTTSDNPSSGGCLANMSPGAYCDTSWSVRATGNFDTRWEFFSVYNNGSLESNRFNVTIQSPPPSLPPGGGGGTAPERLMVSKAIICPDSVQVTTSAGGATVSLLQTDPYAGSVGRGTSDADGRISFMLPAFATYEVDASKSGYTTPEPVTFSFTNATCYVASPPLPANATENVTQPPANVTPPTNANEPAPPENVTPPIQPPVTGACGYAANNAWVGYECCSAGACAAGMVCRNHSCTAEHYQVKGNTSAYVGEEIRLRLQEDGMWVPDLSVRITAPGGSNTTAVTDGSGTLAFGLSEEGSYTLELLEDGIAVKTIRIIALPRLAAAGQPEERSIFAVLTRTGGGLLLVAVLGIAAVAFYWFYFRKGRKG